MFVTISKSTRDRTCTVCKAKILKGNYHTQTVRYESHIKYPIKENICKVCKDHMINVDYKKGVIKHLEHIRQLQASHDVYRVTHPERFV